METIDNLKVAVIVALFIACGAYMYWEKQHPMYCVDTATVESIIEFRYREITIRTTDHRTKIVYQSKVAPGDTTCMEWVRK